MIRPPMEGWSAIRKLAGTGFWEIPPEKSTLPAPTAFGPMAHGCEAGGQTKSLVSVFAAGHAMLLTGVGLTAKVSERSSRR